MIVALVGYMYAGKTTIGKRIANILDFSFEDTDKLVEQMCSSTIENIFRNQGESFFREKEREVLLNLLTKDNIVIATGGGLPCYKDNMSLIKQNCKSIYLYLSPSQILSRSTKSKQKRPLLEKVKKEDRLTFIEESLKGREPFYKQADIVIEGLSINKSELKKSLTLLLENSKI